MYRSLVCKIKSPIAVYHFLFLRKSRIARLSYSLIVLNLIFSLAVTAETVIEQSPLDFGSIALKDNNGAYQYRLRYTGQVINDPEIFIVSPGTPGDYFLSGFPASTLLTISITSPTGLVESPASPVPSNEAFTISNFDYIPSVTTDVNGELTVLVGATITTSGSGSYDDSLYVTTMNINISY